MVDTKVHILLIDYCNIFMVFLPGWLGALVRGTIGNLFQISLRVRNPLPALAREESQSLIKGVRGVTPWQQRVCGCRQGQWGQHPSLTHSRGWVKSRCTSTPDKSQHWEGQKAMFKTQGPVCAKHKSVKSLKCVSRISDRPLVYRVNPVPAVSFEKTTAVGKLSSGRSGFVCYWLFKQTDP